MLLPFSGPILFWTWLKAPAVGVLATFIGTDEPTWRRDFALLFWNHTWWLGKKRKEKNLRIENASHTKYTMQVFLTSYQS